MEVEYAYWQSKDAWLVGYLEEDGKYVYPSNYQTTKPALWSETDRGLAPVCVSS